MPRAKTQTVKKTTKKVEEPKQQTVNIDDLIAHIREEVKKEITADFEVKVKNAEDRLTSGLQQRRDKITLTGDSQYTLQTDTDGLMFDKDENTVLLIGKNGQLATGTKSPRTVGKGSAHFKAGYSSEAVIPISGEGSTRGVIVEGDGDDDKSFTFRAVSRMNRQGVNILSDGSVSIGKMKKSNDATLSVYHRHNEGQGLNVSIPSLEYDDAVLGLSGAPVMSNRYNFIEATADDNNVSSGTKVFKVNGQGDVFAAGGMYSNRNSYAELFEWADGNTRGENRFGFTVAVNEEGKLIVADEGDLPIGVVVPSAALVGNTMWNAWKDKYQKDELGNDIKRQYYVVEWYDNETSLVHSHFKETLNKNFALPENAMELQTDAYGNDLEKSVVNQGFDNTQEYEGREVRQEWATVCVLGTVPVYKGQLWNNNWIKIKDLNDEAELVLIK